MPILNSRSQGKGSIGWQANSTADTTLKSLVDQNANVREQIQSALDEGDRHEMAPRRGVGRDGGSRRNPVLGHREDQLRYQPQTVASPDVASQFGELGSREGWL